MTARAVMLLGTSSHVGKSRLATALCRILAQRGCKVAPFKAQNMSLNSAATPEGLEIGRAQALQAQAAGIPASVHMNPVLIKPAGDTSSQIVVRGKIWRTLTAADYFQSRVDELLPVVRESYEILRARYECIVLEGAGSPVEINLKSRDIVNMRMAALADARCILVADIDRGGVFASLLGTFELLDAEERARFHGFIINKFRGDLNLLLPGIREIEERLQQPCLGIVPYIEDLSLDEEDSLGLERVPVVDWRPEILGQTPSRPLKIAIICLPSLSNFTDFDALRSEPSVSLKYYRTVSDVRFADIILVPGSKETVKDLFWLRAQGLADAILKHHARGGLTIGICGGMQMLGCRVSDPYGIESGGSSEGLGLLQIETILGVEKITSGASGTLATADLFGEACPVTRLRGYEIHVGETRYFSGARPFAMLMRASSDSKENSSDSPKRDGSVAEDRRTFGTYLHGIFEQNEFRHAFLRAARVYFQLEPQKEFADLSDRREREIDRLAEAVSRSVDLASIFDGLGLAERELSSPASESQS